MPGGKGKIKPEEGRQFSADYQPDEKWTEDVALQLGRDLIDWQKEKDGNIFFEDFLIIQKDLYPQLISYLSEKFTSFSKLIERARKIQEIKLKRLGTADVLNATMTKFVLTNDHGWKDKTENEQRVKIVEPITGITVSKK
jgi:hypothetical protein